METASPSLKLESYVFQMMENAHRMASLIGSSSWDLNLNTAMLRLYNPETGETDANLPVQLVGSVSDETQTFLWAWANAESDLPPDALRGVETLRGVAASQGAANPFLIERAFPLPFDEFGMAAAMICAGVTGGFGVYRCPYANGAAYVVIERFPEADALAPDPLLASKAITGSISAFPLEHKTAIEAYVGPPASSGEYVGRGLRVTLDAQGRVGAINMTLGGGGTSNLAPPPPRVDAPPPQVVSEPLTPPPASVAAPREPSTLNRIKGFFGGNKGGG